MTAATRLDFRPEAVGKGLAPHTIPSQLRVLFTVGTPPPEPHFTSAFRMAWALRTSSLSAGPLVALLSLALLPLPSEGLTRYPPRRVAPTPD